MAAFSEFLKAKTGPLPNWAWGLAVVLGVGAALVVPKLFGGQGTTSQTATDSGTPQAGSLAGLDPNGLPYNPYQVPPQQYGGSGVTNDNGTMQSIDSELQQILQLLQQNSTADQSMPPGIAGSCGTGYVNMNGKCIAVGPPQPGNVPPTNGHCPPGYRAINGSCVLGTPGSGGGANGTGTGGTKSNGVPTGNFGTGSGAGVGGFSSGGSSGRTGK